MNTLVTQAISAALSSDWKRAIDCNEQLLSQQEADIDALSRLAFAYTQTGEAEKAKKLYKKILTLDRYNFIAQKNFDKLTALGAKAGSLSTGRKSRTISPQLFLEEPGRTKIVILINPAPLTTLSKLRISDAVYLHPKKHTVEIRDEENKYIGALPDDITYRLLRFLKAGNTYEVYVKNVQKNSISVFIKEIKRGKKFLNQPTFHTSSSDYTSSTPRELKAALDQAEEEKEENQEFSDDE